jgi:arsenate reductase
MDIQLVAHPDCPEADRLQRDVVLAMKVLGMPEKVPTRIGLASLITGPQLFVAGSEVYPCLPTPHGKPCPVCEAMHDSPNIELIRWHLARALGRKTVLFICSGNAVRSQMAEAIINHRLRKQWAAFSGGIFPMPPWKPVITVLKEIGIDADDLKPKHIEMFLGCDFDAIVSLCSNADEFCTAFPGEAVRKHMPFDDPFTSPFFGFGDLGRARDLRDDMISMICPYLGGIP